MHKNGWLVDDLYALDYLVDYGRNFLVQLTSFASPSTASTVTGSTVTGSATGAIDVGIRMGLRLKIIEFAHNKKTIARLLNLCNGRLVHIESSEKKVFQYVPVFFWIKKVFEWVQIVHKKNSNVSI